MTTSVTRAHTCPAAIIATIVSALWLGACAGAVKEGTGAPVPARQDSEVSVIADTDETIWPNPVERTYVRMSTLRNLINGFEARNGSLPQDLEALSTPDHVLPHRMTHDAWNTRISLLRRGSDYELRAAGPDRVTDTDDDLVLRLAEEVPVVHRDSVETTHTRLGSLQLLISLYRYRTGKLPATVQELERAGLNPFLGVLDAWGNTIRYTLTQSDFELRSGGPDGQFGTADDVVLQGLVEIPPH